MDEKFYADDAYNYLVKKGAPPHIAAGMVGNLFQESGMNPRAINPQSGAYGLGQWLGPRKTGLLRFANSKGSSPHDPYLQMDYMLHELGSSEGNALKALNQSQDTPQATIAFSHQFERAGKDERNDARRIQIANQIHSRMNQGGVIPASFNPQGEGMDALPEGAQPLDSSPDESFDTLPEGAQLIGGSENGMQQNEGQKAPETLDDIVRGAKLNLQEKGVGARERLDDIKRYLGGRIGQPYSPEREALNKEGAAIEQNIERLGLPGKVAYHGLDVPIYMAMGVPEAMPARMMANAAMPAALSALRHYNTPDDMQNQVMQSAALGAILPEAMPAVMGAIGKGGRAVGGILNKNVGARNEIGREIGGQLPPAIPPGSSGGQWSELEGVKPTVGMLADGSTQPGLMTLEQNARNRAGGEFYARDVANKKALLEGLKNRSLSREQYRTAIDELNKQTGQLREDAIQVANGNQILANINGREDPILSPLLAKLQEFRTGEGLRGNSQIQSIANGVDKFLQRTNGAPSPEDLYSLRKEIIDSLKGGGLSSDEFTNAIRANRKGIMQVVGSIDKGLNEATGGKWKDYLSAHTKGMVPLESGKAIDDILQGLGNNRPLPGSGNYPNVSPAQLRRLVNSQTQKELGSRIQDRLLPEDRKYVDQAMSFMDAMGRAQEGTAATAGSPTARYLTELAKSGLGSMMGGNMLSKGIGLLDALGRSRGAMALDEALLNPEYFNSVVTGAEKGPLTRMLANQLGHIPLPVREAEDSAIMSRITRRPRRKN